jgi:hypothetical protein
MKISYRGYEIDVRREICLAGYPLLYWSIFREADGLECAAGYEDSAETVREMLKNLRSRVDGELAEEDPWGLGSHK